ncbi:hypothetical protein CFIMG_006927RA [Ceratocystis fimbriata CBS 114723]|uniref:Uncharacterized protein n=1 Tax=Ceratocystis fimbriata CBS 114723 TaxID=1035309 RepID=A0A2C5W2J9_9PEZI|nr:hypothetical protein CFIMG_006927RA [Ceratocystis fimbriata CBS 114723]
MSAGGNDWDSQIRVSDLIEQQCKESSDNAVLEPLAKKTMGLTVVHGSKPLSATIHFFMVPLSMNPLPLSIHCEV